MKKGTPWGFRELDKEDVFDKEGWKQDSNKYRTIFIEVGYVACCTKLESKVYAGQSMDCADLHFTHGLGNPSIGC